MVSYRHVEDYADGVRFVQPADEELPSWASDVMYFIKHDERHGGPYDRGSADSYYGRSYNPHYYTGETGLSTRIEEEQMTKEEIGAYAAGYGENSDFKNW